LANIARRSRGVREAFARRSRGVGRVRPYLVRERFIGRVDEHILIARSRRRDLSFAVLTFADATLLRSGGGLAARVSMALVPLAPLTIAHAHDRLAAVRGSEERRTRRLRGRAGRLPSLAPTPASSSSSCSCAPLLDYPVQIVNLSPQSPIRESPRGYPSRPSPIGRPDRHDPRAAPSRAISFSGMIITTKSDRYAGATNAWRPREGERGGGEGEGVRGFEKRASERTRAGNEEKGGRAGEAMA